MKYIYWKYTSIKILVRSEDGNCVSKEQRASSRRAGGLHESVFRELFPLISSLVLQDGRALGDCERVGLIASRVVELFSLEFLVGRFDG